MSSSLLNIILLKELKDFSRDRLLVSLTILGYLAPLLILLSLVVITSHSEVFARSILSGNERYTQLIQPWGSPVQLALDLLCNYLSLLLFSFMAFISGAYSGIDTIAGEKERGTIETLLAQPVQDWKFVLGKFTSFAVPCIALVVAEEFLFLVASFFLVNHRFPHGIIPNMKWLLFGFIQIPLITLLGALVSVTISFRVNSLRTGYVLISLFAIPLLLVLSPLLQISLRGGGYLLFSIMCLILLDTLAAFLMVRLFNREKILLG